MNGPSQWFAEPGGGTIVTAGYPNDGRDYLAVDPMTDTNGERVVWFDRGHLWGYAVSDPIPGAHLPAEQIVGWSLDWLARYWVYVVPDEEMPRHLRGEDVRLVVPIHHLWLVPQALPAPQPRG